MSDYAKNYRQTPEYKAKNSERMRARNKTEEGAEYERTRRRNPKTRWIKAKYDAKRRKSGAKEFTLTLEEYEKIIANPCYYCNRSIANETGSGIDRIDNDKGYIQGNSNPCCSECNRIRAKSMDAEEFKKQNKLNGRWYE